MGISISVLLGSRKREDISYSDMEYQHSKILEVRRLCSFMKHPCNEIESNEEQNPLAVMRLAKNHMFLLGKLKSWLAKEFSCFNTQNISPPIYQELIYRSPEQCQKMVVARYSVQLQLENRNAFYHGCSRSQMLIWDDCVPPPRMDAGCRGWYIISMEVTVDKIDQGGQSPDNRNPEFYLKVSLNVIRDRMTWPPTDFSPCDVHLQTNTYTYNNVLDPSFLTLHEANTLNPEELDQLIKSIWLGKNELLDEQPKYFMPNLKFLENTESIVPDQPNYEKDTKHLDQWNLNTSRTSNKLSPSSNWKTDFKEKLADVTRTPPERPERSCGAMHADPQNLDPIGKPNKVLPSSCKSVLNLNFLNHVRSIVPKPCLFNTEAKYEEHQKQDTNGKSEKVIRALSRSGSLCFILLLVSTFPVDSTSSPVDHQVKFEISNDSDNNLYCILETEKYFTMAIVYGNYDQNKEPHKKHFNETVQKQEEKYCQERKQPMKTNLEYLQTYHKVNSGGLQFVITWTLDESYNMTHMIVQYIFNNRSLTNEEMLKLPFPISDGRDYTNLSNAEYLKKIEDQGTVLWESFRAEIIPYLKKGDVSETTTSLPSSTTETTRSKKENSNLLAILAVIFIILLTVTGFTLCLKFYGKKTCTRVNETFFNVRYGAAVRTEDDVEEGEDHVAIHVQ